jgi:hypothetical protein
MHDDAAMDGLLRKALAADAPCLSTGFDAAVTQRVRPRRLSARGRLAMVVYAIVALALSAWSMRDLDPRAIAVGVTAGLAVASGASAYVRRLAIGD